VIVISSDEAVVGRDVDGVSPRGRARTGEFSLLVGELALSATGFEVVGAGMRDCLFGEGVRGDSTLALGLKYEMRCVESPLLGVRGV
jgi:hypothetical protein